MSNSTEKAQAPQVSIFDDDDDLSTIPSELSSVAGDSSESEAEDKAKASSEDEMSEPDRRKNKLQIRREKREKRKIAKSSGNDDDEESGSPSPVSSRKSSRSDDGDEYHLPSVPKKAKLSKEAKDRIAEERKRKAEAMFADDSESESEDERTKPGESVFTSRKRKASKKRRSPSPKPQVEEREVDKIWNQAMAAIKAEGRGRRRRDYDEAAIDDECDFLIKRMHQAAYEDQKANEERKPGMNKLDLLPEVVRICRMPPYFSSLLDTGLLPAIREWLEPLPDTSLPALEIRKSMLDILERLPIQTDHLRTSRVGRVILFYSKVEREIPEIRKRAKDLVFKWSKPILSRGKVGPSGSADTNEQDMGAIAAAEPASQPRPKIARSKREPNDVYKRLQSRMRKIGNAGAGPRGR